MAGESARERALKARERSARLVEYADRYERGADGEAATAGVLDDLGPHWRRLDDVHWPGRPYANIDHIVIGPPGVFVIDTKNWSGNLDIGPTKIRQNGRSRQRALDGVQLAAREVAQIVDPRARPRTLPMLCFVRDVAIRGMVGKVMVCSTSTIVTRLDSMTPVFDDAEVRAIAEHLVAHLPPATEPSAELADTKARAVRGKLGRPASWKGRAFAFKLAACVAVAAGGVYLAGHAADLVSSPDTAQYDSPTKGGTPADKDASLNQAPRPDGSSRQH
jgi:hypothetical protein